MIHATCEIVRSRRVETLVRFPERATRILQPCWQELASLMEAPLPSIIQVVVQPPRTCGAIEQKNAGAILFNVLERRV